MQPPIKPTHIYSKLKQICRHMVHGHQEDAHEFVRYLLDAVHRSYLVAHALTQCEPRVKETAPVSQIFGGYLRNQVTCLRCHYVSTTQQHFQDIMLDINQTSRMSEALQHYFRNERLEASGFKCERCKTKVPITKKFSIQQPPLVLCVQFKRFRSNYGKINKFIEYNTLLNIAPYMSRCKHSQINYWLCSVINHTGTSQNCGHYTAMVCAQPQQSTAYYLYDDARVRLTSAANFISGDAYLLFYEMTSESHRLLFKLSSSETKQTLHSEDGAKCSSKFISHTTDPTRKRFDKQRLNGTTPNLQNIHEKTVHIQPQHPGVGVSCSRVTHPDVSVSPPQRLATDSVTSSRQLTHTSTSSATTMATFSQHSSQSVSSTQQHQLSRVSESLLLQHSTSSDRNSISVTSPTLISSSRKHLSTPPSIVRYLMSDRREPVSAWDGLTTANFNVAPQHPNCSINDRDDAEIDAGKTKKVRKHLFNSRKIYNGSKLFQQHQERCRSTKGWLTSGFSSRVKKAHYKRFRKGNRLWIK